jgi:hypothetical protein
MPFSFIFNREKGKIGWVGDHRGVLYKKFTGEKGRVRRCLVVMLQETLLPPKFNAKSPHIFKQSLKNFIIACGIDCLAFQGELYVNNSLDVKITDEHALIFALHLPFLFRSAQNIASHSNTHVKLKLSFPNACLIIVRVCVFFSRDLQTFDAQ